MQNERGLRGELTSASEARMTEEGQKNAGEFSSVQSDEAGEETEDL